MKKKSLTAVMLIAMSISAFAQITLKGKVIDSKEQQPMPGTTLRIANTYNVLNTDADGLFIFKNLKKGEIAIEVSFLGYESITLKLNLLKDTSITILLSSKTFLADEVVVLGLRAQENSPNTYTQLDNKHIEQKNMGQEISYILNQTPSIVVTSDAGAGVGYTGMRIRGTDPTRINVTINGIPVNDAESQGTFWVNLPDIASSIDNIQIQRGVGSSSNGAAAFGASLNIQTNTLNESAYATLSSSRGSFNTAKNTLLFGSGIINKKWTFDLRLSKLASDGYIDRAFSDLKSYYFSGGYYGKKTIIKFISFSGKERTYQAWYGVPEARLKNDVAGMQQLLDNYSISQQQYDNMINSNNRTFNIYTYSNQTDNYQQDYYQLHYNYEVSKKLNLNAALHYTKGAGYYEEYKNDQKLNEYGLADIVFQYDTIKSTNLIRRKWLDNDFFGLTYTFNYDNKKNIQITLGGAANKYFGSHFGNIIWAEYASNSAIDKKYYDDEAEKKDVNAFIKLNYSLNKKLKFFSDIQYRTVYYSFYGYNDKFENVEQGVNLYFINPKVGLSYVLYANNYAYISYAMANKEPNRDDYVQSTPQSRPKSENLQNIETGYVFKAEKWTCNLNYFFMYYLNQLVLTGEINDVGAYNRANIEKSYRSGIELSGAVKPLKKLEINANLSYSSNKVLDYVEYIDNWDDGTQLASYIGKSDISFSPSLIAGSSVSYFPFKKINILWFSKYVGKQYLDNSSNINRMLKSWFVNDFQIVYALKFKTLKEVSLNFMLNNIFNRHYESNGWSYTYLYNGKKYIENWLYPQAGRNFLFGITIKF